MIPDEDITTYERQIEHYKGQAEEFLAGWKRSLADYQNREREIAKERNEIAAIASRGVIMDFFPVLDNLMVAFSHIPEADRGTDWSQGLAHVIRQFEDMLKGYGISAIVTKDQKFDPALHEAAGEEEAPGIESGMIVREVQTGFAMNGKVLRPARVIIAK